MLTLSFPLPYSHFSLSFLGTLWLLTQNQDVQNKLRAEVSELLAINKNPDYHQVKSLKYLDAVISESLRLRPPVPAAMRRAEENDVIDGHYIPRGTFVYISSRTINADVHVWGEDASECEYHFVKK